MLHEDRSRAESFGQDAAAYHAERPSYPPALVDALVDPPVRDVLDVGCGTGIASALLTARGARVLGVEPDPRMAAVAREGGLEVEVAAFETWDAAGRTFDLVMSAQAWHWVDAAAGSARAAEVLRPGGRIGLFWNFGRPTDAIRDALGAAYAAAGESDLERHSVLLGNADDRLTGTAAALDTTGAFGRVAVRAFPWVREYGRDAWIRQLFTHSDHAALPADRRAALSAAVAEAVDGLGGTVALDYDARLVTAVRRG
ncbi:class I SAM-dependent methyltransferase [Patulibacter minatonensis]|uniref:class I SAM-dependent methyltransferase n=1 Tax=Patulibacter minatonensis TaxID=298163 RepID=UPI000479CB5C|nr:class I SAM-dependent methyltransferase [Patulibacter minatonensis]